MLLGTFAFEHYLIFIRISFVSSIMSSSSRHFGSCYFRASCFINYSNNSWTFFRGKESSRDCHSWSVCHLSFLFKLGTFLLESWATVKASFLVVPEFSGWFLWGGWPNSIWGPLLRSYRNDELMITSTSFLSAIQLFRWISISYAFMHRLSNPLKVYGMSTSDRSCQKLLTLISISSCCMKVGIRG